MTVRKIYSGTCPICNQLASYPGNGIELVKFKRGGFQTYHSECVEHERRKNNERRHQNISD